MAEWVLGFRLSITRFISDEPQPGIVACEFTDAHGRRWTFTEKTAIVSGEYLDGESSYPRPGVLWCEVVGRRPGASGGEVIEIATPYFPDGIESDEEKMRFDVSPDSLVECEWGTDRERPWSGRT